MYFIIKYYVKSFNLSKELNKCISCFSLYALNLYISNKNVIKLNFSKNRFNLNAYKIIYLFIIIIILSIISNMVYAADGFVAYRSPSGNGVNYPKVRFWNSSGNGTWGNEIELPSAGSALRNIVLKTSPLSSKVVIITSANDGFLDAYVCINECNNASSWYVYNNFATSIVSTQRNFDFDFESNTGNLVLVYATPSTDTTRDLAYRILPSEELNFSATTEFFIDDVTESVDISYSWVSVDASPLSSSAELVLVGFDSSSSDINAWVWNGSVWGSQLSLSVSATATTGYEALAVSYNSNGSKAMVLGADGTVGLVNWAFWNGSWSAVGSFDVDAADANDVRWLSLKPNPLSLDFQAVFVDSGNDLGSAFYNDSSNSWVVTSNIDAAVDISTRRCADFSWLPDGSSGVLVWDTDTTGSTLSLRVCSPLCTSATSTFSSYAGSGGWITLYRNLNTSDIAKILGFRYSASFNIGSFFYNGSVFSNYGDTALSTGGTINTYESYSFDFIKSRDIPFIISFVFPTYENNSFINTNFTYINVSVSNSLASCTLNWSGILYNMLGSGNYRYYNVTNITDGEYYYYVTCNVSYSIKYTESRILSIDTTIPVISFVAPTPYNNSISEDLNLSINITSNENLSSCFFNLSDDLSSNVYVMNGSYSNWYIDIYPLYNGFYSYYVYCNDSYGNYGYSETRYLTVNMPIADGFVAYRSPSGNGVNYPKVRFWNSSGNGTWGNEIELPSAGSPIRFVVLKSSPLYYKLILVTLSDDGFLDGYVCYSNCSNSSNWVVSNDFAQSITASSQRSFDFDFESSTGNAIIVYAIPSTSIVEDLAYRVIPSSSANISDTTEFFIDDVTASVDISYSWVSVDASPLSSSAELVLVGFDSSSSDINAWVWNGSVWGSQLSLSVSATATSGYEALAVSYNSNGSKAMVLGADGTVGLVNWAFWNGSWSVVGSFDVDAADANDVRWLSLKSNPLSLDFQAVFVDSGNDLGSAFYNDSSNSWVVTSNIDAAVDISTRRCADFSWLPDGSSGVLVWDTDTTGSTLSLRVCSPLCTSATSTFSSYAGSGGWITLYRNILKYPVAKILGFRYSASFNIGSFFYNGSVFSNYGDTALSTGDTINTYESYSFDFIRKNNNSLIINFVYPTDPDGANISRVYSFVNVTVYPSTATCVLNWSGTLYSMNSFGNNRYYNKTGLFTGTEYYHVICNTSSVVERTRTRSININTTFPINIGMIFPTQNYLSNIPYVNFTFNVSHPLWNVSNCSLIINDIIVNNTNNSPLPQNTNITLSAVLVSGIYNWSVNCTDEYNIITSSQKINFSVYVPPYVTSLYIEDYVDPIDQIILSAGSFRKVYCIVVASDFFGPDNVNTVSSVFHYYLNSSNGLEDNNVRYINNSCALNETTSMNKTFVCSFNVYYYANNGTWNCTTNVYNNQSAYSVYSNLTNITPLYALNITDGITFDDTESGFESSEAYANVTNIGNMPINISIQGYAISIGDAVGMNCSDGTNISIDSIRYSLSSSSYSSKIPLTGFLQNTSLSLPKQTNSSAVYNVTYWQIKPTPSIGSISRVCTGYVIFNAEIS
ncbi:MAG: hypothetical protein KatS3mg002_1213 [Candidatus Woesearchaeota archaeon]|nr:MAG: hypothetical protein KatS3mg002_1213 [Candidatus Woesearchaeota archaeon]